MAQNPPTLYAQLRLYDATPANPAQRTGLQELEDTVMDKGRLDKMSGEIDLTHVYDEQVHVELVRSLITELGLDDPKRKMVDKVRNVSEEQVGKVKQLVKLATGAMKNWTDRIAIVAAKLRIPGGVASLFLAAPQSLFSETDLHILRCMDDLEFLAQIVEFLHILMRSDSKFAVPDLPRNFHTFPRDVAMEFARIMLHKFTEAVFTDNKTFLHDFLLQGYDWTPYDNQLYNFPDMSHGGMETIVLLQNTRYWITLSAYMRLYKIRYDAQDVLKPAWEGEYALASLPVRSSYLLDNQLRSVTHQYRDIHLYGMKKFDFERGIDFIRQVSGVCELVLTRYSVHLGPTTKSELKRVILQPPMHVNLHAGARISIDTVLMLMHIMQPYYDDLASLEDMLDWNAFPHSMARLTYTKKLQDGGYAGPVEHNVHIAKLGRNYLADVIQVFQTHVVPNLVSGVVRHLFGDRKGATLGPAKKKKKQTQKVKQEEAEQRDISMDDTYTKELFAKTDEVDVNTIRLLGLVNDTKKDGAAFTKELVKDAWMQVRYQVGQQFFNTVQTKLGEAIPPMDPFLSARNCSGVEGDFLYYWKQLLMPIPSEEYFRLLDVPVNAKLRTAFIVRVCTGIIRHCTGEDVKLQGAKRAFSEYTWRANVTSSIRDLKDRLTAEGIRPEIFDTPLSDADGRVVLESSVMRSIFECEEMEYAFQWLAYKLEKNSVKDILAHLEETLTGKYTERGDLLRQLHLETVCHYNLGPEQFPPEKNADSVLFPPSSFADELKVVYPIFVNPLLKTRTQPLTAEEQLKEEKKALFVQRMRDKKAAEIPVTPIQPTTLQPLDYYMKRTINVNILVEVCIASLFSHEPDASDSSDNEEPDDMFARGVQLFLHGDADAKIIADLAPTNIWDIMGRCLIPEGFGAFRQTVVELSIILAISIGLVTLTRQTMYHLETLADSAEKTRLIAALRRGDMQSATPLVHPIMDIFRYCFAAMLARTDAILRCRFFPGPTRTWYRFHVPTGTATAPAEDPWVENIFCTYTPDFQKQWHDPAFLQTKVNSLRDKLYWMQFVMFYGLSEDQKRADVSMGIVPMLAQTYNLPALPAKKQTLEKLVSFGFDQRKINRNRVDDIDTFLRTSLDMEREATNGFALTSVPTPARARTPASTPTPAPSTPAPNTAPAPSTPANAGTKRRASKSPEEKPAAKKRSILEDEDVQQKWIKNVRDKYPMPSLQKFKSLQEKQAAVAAILWMRDNDVKEYVPAVYAKWRKNVNAPLRAIGYSIYQSALNATILEAHARHEESTFDAPSLEKAGVTAANVHLFLPYLAVGEGPYDCATVRDAYLARAVIHAVRVKVLQKYKVKPPRKGRDARWIMQSRFLGRELRAQSRFEQEVDFDVRVEERERLIQKDVAAEDILTLWEERRGRNARDSEDEGDNIEGEDMTAHLIEDDDDDDDAVGIPEGGASFRYVTDKDMRPIVQATMDSVLHRVGEIVLERKAIGRYCKNALRQSDILGTLPNTKGDMSDAVLHAALNEHRNMILLFNAALCTAFPDMPDREQVCKKLMKAWTSKEYTDPLPVATLPQAFYSELTCSVFDRLAGGN